MKMRCSSWQLQTVPVFRFFLFFFLQKTFLFYSLFTNLFAVETAWNLSAPLGSSRQGKLPDDEDIVSYF